MPVTSASPFFTVPPTFTLTCFTCPDASLVRPRSAAQNFSFLRRLALNLFRADTSRSISLPGKLKTAAYNPGYLAAALRLRKI